MFFHNQQMDLIQPPFRTPGQMIQLIQNMVGFLGEIFKTNASCAEKQIIMHQLRLLFFNAASDLPFSGSRRQGSPPFHRDGYFLTHRADPDPVAAHGVAVIFFNRDLHPAVFKIRAGKAPGRNLHLTFLRRNGSLHIAVCRQDQRDLLPVLSRVKHHLFFFYGKGRRFFPSRCRQEFFHDHISGTALHQAVIHGVLFRQMFEENRRKIREEKQLHGLLPVLMVKLHEIFHLADAANGSLRHHRRHHYPVRDVVLSRVGDQQKISFKFIACGCQFSFKIIRNLYMCPGKVRLLQTDFVVGRTDDPLYRYFIFTFNDKRAVVYSAFFYGDFKVGYGNAQNRQLSFVCSLFYYIFLFFQCMYPPIVQAAFPQKGKTAILFLSFSLLTRMKHTGFPLPF